MSANGDVRLDGLRERIHKASALLKAMSNENRLLILCELLAGERTVGELESAVGLSQSALSQHLARLRRDSIVKTRRDRQSIHYSLNGSHANEVLEVLHRLYCEDEGAEPRTAQRAGS